MVPGWDFSCIMAGAVVADLVPESRIDTYSGAVFVADFRPTVDELLNPTLEEIVQPEKTFGTRDWTERNTSRSEEIVTGALDRLVYGGCRIQWCRKTKSLPSIHSRDLSPTRAGVSARRLALPIIWHVAARSACTAINWPGSDSAVYYTEQILVLL